MSEQIVHTVTGECAVELRNVFKKEFIEMLSEKVLWKLTLNVSGRQTLTRNQAAGEISVEHTQVIRNILTVRICVSTLQRCGCVFRGVLAKARACWRVLRCVLVRHCA